jgi:hypothetical protein
VGGGGGGHYLSVEKEEPAGKTTECIGIFVSAPFE